jgi:hypothetical protein
MTPSPAERVVRRFYQQYVNERDRALVDLVFSPSPTQACLDEALRVCDIEVLGAHKSLMLSYFMRDHPGLEFPPYAKPRLQGLVDFYRFANVGTLAHFAKIGRALNAGDIPILLFKGAAMKVLRPDLPRPMGDVDILVPPECLARAVKICVDLGYHDAMTGTRRAVDIHSAENESAVDIHSAILEGGKNAAAFHRDLFARARALEAFGARVFLPAHEDLLFIVLANLTKNLREKTSIHGLFYALLDTRFLLADKPDFAWGIVRENVRNTDTELPVRFGAEFMNSLVPGLVPAMDAHLPLSPRMEAYCNQIIFDEEYFNKRQTACQAIRVVDLKNYPWHYGRMILNFLLLKKLRRLPAFVRWYLKTRMPDAASSGGEAGDAR